MLESIERQGSIKQSQLNDLEKKQLNTSVSEGNFWTASGQSTEISTGAPENVIVGRNCCLSDSKWYLK